MLRPFVILLVFNLPSLRAQSNIVDTGINTTIPPKGPRSQDSLNVSTALSSSDTTATDTDLTSHIDATNPTTLMSSSQGPIITSNGSLITNITELKSTPSFTSHALSSLPSNGMVASSGFLTYGYRSFQGISSRANGSLITGVTAASRPVTTTGFSNHVINQTSVSYANGTYLNQSAQLTAPAAIALMFALHTERALVPVKQSAAFSTNTAQLSQLDPSSAAAPSPAQSGTAGSEPHPSTSLQQNNPSIQAASLPGSDNHGSAAPAYISPQITTQQAPVIAGKPVVDAGPFQSSSVTPGPAENGPMANEPAGADIPAGDSALKLPSEPAVSTMMIAGAPVVNYPGSLKVKGTPLAAGATIALSGTIWSLSPSSPPNSVNLNVGGKTYNLPPMTLPPITTIAGHEVQALGPSAIAIDGQTLTQGAPPLTIASSVPVIFGPSSLVIGTSAFPIQLQREAPLPSILNLAGGQSLTQVPNTPNAYLVSGTTLLPGLPAAIISGTSYSLDPSGALILGSSTIPLATAGRNAANGVLTAGSEVFTPLGSTAVAVNGATLSLNGPGTTDQGTVLSLGPGGLVVGSSTYAFATPGAAAAAAPSAAATTQQFPITTVLSAAGHTFTANPSGFSVAGTTLSPGSPGITIAGTRISLGASGILDIGSSTVNLSPTALTVAGQTFIPEPTAFSIAGTTLTAGGPGITISGTLISLGTSGLLDIGGSTIKLSSPTAYTIAGQTFTPNPTAFSVDGTTITAGGPGLNINGTSLLLEPGAKLVIGNTTISLPASNLPSATSTPNITASSISVSSSTIAPGGGSTSALVGGAGAARTGSKVRGGAVGMRCKIFWWEVVGFVGFWMIIMMVV